MTPTDHNSPQTVSSRFAGALLDVLDRVEYARVRMDETSSPIYKLRYDAYRREEFVPFNDAGIVTDDLDGTGNAYAFGVFIDGELVSSLRIHHLTQQCRKAPSMKSFPDVLGPLLDQGQSFVDPSRFTADYEASLAYPALPFLTLRLAVMATDYFETTSCLSLVRREHAAFYRRVFGSVEMGSAREYPGLAFPVVLFGSDRRINLQQIYKRYPFFRSTFEEQERLFAQDDMVFDGLVPATGRKAFAMAVPETSREVVAA